MDCYDVLTTLAVLDSFSDLAAVTVTVVTAVTVNSCYGCTDVLLFSFIQATT